MNCKNDNLQELLTLKYEIIESIKDIRKQNIDSLAMSFRVNQKLINFQKIYYEFMNYQGIKYTDKRQLIKKINVFLVLIVLQIILTIITKNIALESVFLASLLITSAVFVPIVGKDISKYFSNEKKFQKINIDEVKNKIKNYQEIINIYEKNHIVCCNLLDQLEKLNMLINKKIETKFIINYYKKNLSFQKLDDYKNIVRKRTK